MLGSSRATSPYGLQVHREGVERLLRSYRNIPERAPVRLAKKTSNLFRARAKVDAPGLDVSGLGGVVSVDPRTRTADVAGMCTYEDLVDATLPYGLAPLVVPQLKTITLGGAVTGLGIESTSFRNGLPHESVLEMDILTGAGEIVTARPDGEHSDLFRGFPNSYGSLGYATRLRIELEPVKRFVALRHLRFDSLAEMQAALDRITADRVYAGVAVDYIDGVVFSADRKLPHARRRRRTSRVRYPTTPDATSTTGPSSTRRSTIPKPIGSRSATTCGAGTPTGSGVRGRSGHKTPESAGSGRSDCCAAVSTGSSSRWTTNTRSPIESRHARAIPLVSVSCRTSRYRSNAPRSSCGGSSRKSPSSRYGCARCDCAIVTGTGGASFDAQRPWPLYPLEPKRTYVNVGFWSSVPADPGGVDGAANRLIENKVAELDGHKSLYSDSYYTRDEFEKLYYSGGDYTALKKKYDPRSRLLDLFSKAVQRR